MILPVHAGNADRVMFACGRPSGRFSLRLSTVLQRRGGRQLPRSLTDAILEQGQ